jgi:hypothetical protein
VEIISLHHSEHWDAIVRSMYAYDVYHLSAYHRLDTAGEALLLHYCSDDGNFALPVIVRKIADTDYSDITSVYGYAGVLSNREHPHPEAVRRFVGELKFFFDERRIVSVFARLHPLIACQEPILSPLGSVEFANLTVGVDLRLPEKLQRQQYARSLKTQINRLQRIGFSVRQTTAPQDVARFADMYYETMDRVQAASRYYFPLAYFDALLRDTNACLFLAMYEGQAVSGSLCTFTNDIMQAHLNATTDRFLAFSPLKLVLDEARKEGIRRGMNILHLGGGKGGHDDSLFTFKSRFSKQYFPFKLWRYVHLPEIYQNLSNEKASNTDFFPAYRR